MPENIGEKLSSADEKEPTTKELEIPKSASDEVNPRKKRTTDLAPPVEIQAKLEKEVEDLSKEEIERIMEKVEDINSMGTTSHAVREGSGYVSAKSPESKKRRNFNILSNILNHGIIGGPRNWNDADFLSNEKSIKAIFKNLSYARRAGHGWPTFVVDINELPSDRPFSRVGWIGENGIALIVDKEFAKTKRDRLYKKRIYSRGGKEKSGNTTTSTRIPPRFIKGIVINPVASVKAIEEESKILEKRENIINEILELRKFLYSQVEKQLGDKTKFIVSITDEVKKSHSDVMLKLKELNLQIALVYKEIEKINPDLYHQLHYPKILNPFTQPENKDVQSFFEEVIKTERQSNVLLPIYSLDGDLLWPKKMNYEEVKKFVEEREKVKEKGEQ